MKDIKISHVTPDGKEIIIRAVKESDAENLLALKKSYLKNTTTIPLYEDEYTNTIEQEAEWIKKYIEQDNCLLLVAEHNGELIGNLDLTGNQRKKMYHTGMIGMGVKPEWQNKKIGSLIMKNTLEWAKKSPLEIVWLEVYSTNPAGRKLYENYGFEICGLIEYFFKEELPADKITMVKYLE
jgi:ribosomal protein S18 acetylase RimI-like enzyme